MSEDYALLKEIASNDVRVLEKKGQTYGSSWRNRGGVGAFMMLARKWDRIENQCKELGYDIFNAIEGTEVVDGILDDIQDLRRYLLLVEGHMAHSVVAKLVENEIKREPTKRRVPSPRVPTCKVCEEVEAACCCPTSGYVNQDPLPQA